MSLFIECWNCSAGISVGDFADSEMGDLVRDLATAIRKGDTAEAEILLDRLAEDIPGWAERIAVGRYSRRARAA